jgi:putative transposase
MTYSLEDKKMLLEKNNSDLSLRKQCDLLSLNRSNCYYKPKDEKLENIFYMNMLDKQYTKTPFFGVIKMTEFLRDKGYKVNPKRIRRLLRKMGLEAIYPKPKLSQRNPEHKIYPYLLRGLKIEYVNQVWSTDITYIKLSHGHVYLMAIIDWHSRYVLNWKLSTTLEAEFCIEALNETLSTGKCEIFNTDQGSQFTTKKFTTPLINKGIKVSMDGRGRALDNIFVERLWRSVKYENIYLHDYQTVNEVYQGLTKYFNFYNYERFHQALDYKTPATVYFAGLKIQQ